MARPDPEALIARATELLRLPRIGLLWCRGAVPSPWTLSGTRGVHYLEEPRAAGLHPFYLLEGLSLPEREARTLALLAVLEPPVSLVAELVSGLGASPAARLASACLDEGVPVLLDPSRLESWLAGAGAGARDRWTEARGVLEARGVRWLGSGGAAPLPKAPDHPGALRLDPGWHAWGELSGRTEGCSAVVLAPGARLTPEARERLRVRGIPVREEGTGWR